MKKVLITALAIIALIPGIASAGSGGLISQAARNAALNYVATNGTVWSFVDVTGAGGLAGLTYTEANSVHNNSTGFSIAKVTVASGAGSGATGSGGYSAISAGVQAGSFAIDMMSVTGMTQASGALLASGKTATHICILYPAQSEIVACLPLQQDKSFTDHTTETWDFAGIVDAIEFRSLTAAQ